MCFCLQIILLVTIPFFIDASKFFAKYRSFCSEKVIRQRLLIEGEYVRGLCVTNGTTTNEILLNLPQKEVLIASEMKEDFRDCPIQEDENLVKQWKTFGGKTRLALKLLLEKRQKQPNSNLLCYLNDLPEIMETPIYWTERNLESLGSAYAPLKLSIQRQKEVWLGLYKTLTATSRTFTEQNLSFEDFVWAMSIVSSRAFSGFGGNVEGGGRRFSFTASLMLVSAAATAASSQSNEGQRMSFILGTLGVLAFVPEFLFSQKKNCVLLPLIDSSNHDSANPLGQLAYEPNLGSYVVRARSNTKQQQHLTISYGERSNDYLLQYFGFVETNNLFDNFVILDPLAVLKSRVSELTYHLTLAQKAVLFNDFKSVTSSEAMLIIRRGKCIEEWSFGVPLKKILSSIREMDVGTPNDFFSYAVPFLETIIRAELESLEKALSSQTDYMERESVTKEDRLLERFLQGKCQVLREATKILQQRKESKKSHL